MAADNPVNQSKLDGNTCNWREARENVCERVTITFGFTSDWMQKKWWELFKPITKRNNTNPKQMRITIDAPAKTALFAATLGEIATGRL